MRKAEGGERERTSRPLTCCCCTFQPGSFDRQRYSWPASSPSDVQPPPRHRLQAASLGTHRAAAHWLLSLTRAAQASSEAVPHASCSTSGASSAAAASVSEEQHARRNAACGMSLAPAASVAQQASAPRRNTAAHRSGAWLRQYRVGCASRGSSAHRQSASSERQDQSERRSRRCQSVAVCDATHGLRPRERRRASTPASKSSRSCSAGEPSPAQACGGSATRAASRVRHAMLR